jgi:hypothetical protein
MTQQPVPGPDPGNVPTPPAPQRPSARTPQTIAAAAVAIVSLLGVIVALIAMPDRLEAISSAVSIAGAGLALASKVAQPR